MKISGNLIVKSLLFIILFTSSFLVSAQEKEYTQEEIDSIINRTIPDQEIDDIVVIYRDAKSQAKLRRDVLKAYPYALRAASIIEQIETHILTIDNKKKKKRYLKKKEKLLKEQFEKNIRKLTKTQGRYMVRLINRETDIAVYDIIKDYKGGLNASFWQVIAKKFDSDLKSEYDKDNIDSIDYEIEQIVKNLSPRYVNRIKAEVVVDPPTYRDYQKN